MLSSNKKRNILIQSNLNIKNASRKKKYNAKEKMYCKVEVTLSITEIKEQQQIILGGATKIIKHHCIDASLLKNECMDIKS